ncbi:hypothetical protein [Shewanella zhangzhouensis]|nr:hypothetical protein [Shewanella zhangzhouensis]QYK04586.1 hypothetical protein K0H63_16225 [Shewanella zhangzhouensis]
MKLFISLSDDTLIPIEAAEGVAENCVARHGCRSSASRIRDERLAR